MQRLSLAAVLFLLPSLALAAGFAKQSLFLSQSSVAQGDTVSIYAVVENDTANNFSGALKFADQNGAIGSAPVTLQSGRAATVSVSWTPKAGEHHVTANLVTSDGKAAESEEADFLIAPALNDVAANKNNTSAGDAALASLASSTSQASSSIQTSAPIEGWIQSTLPAAGNITAPLLKAVDSARAGGAQKLDGGSAWAKSALGTAATAPSGFGNTLWLIATTLVLYVCTALSYAIKNIGIFYPAVALLFLYILWRMYRVVRRR